MPGIGGQLRRRQLHPPYLSTIAANTLIVFGDSDPLYPVSLALDLHAAIPRSRLWVVPGGGHGPVFGDDASRFAETALSFLGRIPTRTRSA